MSKDTIFQIKGLKTQFFTAKGIVPAVDGVDITVKKGEAVGLVGESGCGKSMTAMSVMQLLQYPGTRWSRRWTQLEYLYVKSRVGRNQRRLDNSVC